MKLAIPPVEQLDDLAEDRVTKCVLSLIDTWNFCVNPLESNNDVLELGTYLRQLDELRAPLINSRHLRYGSRQTSDQVVAWNINITRLALEQCGFNLVMVNELKGRDLPSPGELALMVELSADGLASLRLTLNSYVQYLGWCVAQQAQAGVDISPPRRLRHARGASRATDRAHSLLVTRAGIAEYEDPELASLAWRYIRYNLVFRHLGLEGV